LEKQVRWETPFSDIPFLGMWELVDDGELHIQVGEGLPESTIKKAIKWMVEFEKYATYRNSNVDFYLITNKIDTGNSINVENSNWIEQLKSEHVLFSDNHKTPVHFIFSTGDDILEVISCVEPKITELK